MRVEKIKPEPVEIPPTTYNISDLSFEELTRIRSAVFYKACNDRIEARKEIYQSLHKQIWVAQFDGEEYIGGYDPEFA